MSNISLPDWDAIRRAEWVLRKHHIPDERLSYNGGDRPHHVIEAIIRDIKVANR